MNYCYRITGNYGLAIILFTFFSKLVLLPVSIWVQKNSIKMVKMQPELNRIKIAHFGDKDTIAEKESALYKKEKYNPLASLVPLAAQIILLMGVVAVIYHPLNYLFKIDENIIHDLNRITLSEIESISPDSSSLQLYTVENIQKNPDAYEVIKNTYSAETADYSLNEIRSFDMTFLGIDLSWTASLLGGFVYIVPLIAGLSALLLCIAQNKSNVLQSAQSVWNQWGMTILSVGLSLYLGTFVPAGVALYWVASNLMAIVLLYLLNAMINPKKYVDYTALKETQAELSALEGSGKKKKRKRNDPLAIKEKEDYKQFFSIGNKHLVFYSESNGFYKYYAGIIEYLLKYTNIPIHYITGDANDNIFKMEKEYEQIHAYFIEENKLIPLMMKMDADIVVMTMPDLENFHIKRSIVKKDIEYIYMPHGVGSNNLTMRTGSMDHYDTIFASGEHQKEEVVKTEIAYNLPKKKIVEVGYPLLDDMIKSYTERHPGVREGYAEDNSKEKKTIMIAPSWQKDNIIDSCLEEILDHLKGYGYQIIVRPHPQHVRHMPEKMEALKEKYKENKDIIIQTDFSSTDTVFEADLMITDWSDIASEYSFTTCKPVLYIDTPMKIMNPEYTKIDTVPFNIWIREKTGLVVKLNEINQISDYVEKLLKEYNQYKKAIYECTQKYVYRIGDAGETGARYIINRIFENIENKESETNG